MREGNIVQIKSKSFAIRTIKLFQFLKDSKNEYVMSKQLLRSGTSIGANLREAEHAQSKADFLHKVNVALKEANETLYWLELLNETEYISDEGFDSLKLHAEELLKLLASIVKTTKANLKR